ncbi:unnamed protein product [Lampetra fluviatilis]
MEPGFEPRLPWVMGDGDCLGVSRTGTVAPPVESSPKVARVEASRQADAGAPVAICGGSHGDEETWNPNSSRDLSLLNSRHQTEEEEEVGVGVGGADTVLITWPASAQRHPEPRAERQAEDATLLRRSFSLEQL